MVCFLRVYRYCYSVSGPGMNREDTREKDNHRKSAASLIWVLYARTYLFPMLVPSSLSIPLILAFGRLVRSGRHRQHACRSRASQSSWNMQDIPISEQAYMNPRAGMRRRSICRKNTVSGTGPGEYQTRPRTRLTSFRSISVPLPG